MADLRIDDGTFEANVSGWYADGGSVARSTAQAHTGSASALLTVSGSPSQAYIRTNSSTSVPVTPFEQYTVGCWVRSPQTLTVRMSIDWFTAALDYISTSTGSSVVLVANTWTQLPALTDAAPATADLASYGPTAFAPANGNTLYIDDVTIDDATITAVSITADEQDVWPARVLVSVTGLTLGDQVTVYRVVGGQRTALRGGHTDDATDTALLVTDAELPYGVPVSYLALVGTTEYETSAATYELVGGKAVLSDAITGLAVEATILNWDSSEFDRQATVSKVGGRNVAVLGPLGQAEQDIEVYFETTVANDQFLTLMEAATEGIIQIREPGGYEDVYGYFAITKAARRRFSQDGTDPRRTWVLHAVSVDAWADSLEPAGFSYADVAAFYETAGGTYADLADDFPTYLAVAQADWS